MKGRRRRDDGSGSWSSGVPDGWLKRRLTDGFARLDHTGPSRAAHGGDRPAGGGRPAEAGYQRPDGQAGFGGGRGAGDYAGQWPGEQPPGGSGQGFGDVTRAIPPFDGSAQGYGDGTRGVPSFGANGGVSGGATSGGPPWADLGREYGDPAYGGQAPGGTGAVGRTGAPGGAGTGFGGAAPSGPGYPGGAQDAYGYGGYGTSGYGAAVPSYDYGGTGIADTGFGRPAQSSGYQDAGYGQPGYGFGETSAIGQYGRLPAAEPSGPSPELAAPEYAASDWGLTANEGSPGTPRPYGRLSIFTLLEDKAAEFDRLAEQAAEGVRTTEPDTLVYVIHVVPKAPMQRIIYEIYRDRAAFESHERQSHIQRFVSERKACVLATNIIDLRLKYAKVAALAAPAAFATEAEQESGWAPRALERAPSFSPHGSGPYTTVDNGGYAESGNGRVGGNSGWRGGSDGRSPRPPAPDWDQTSYQDRRYGG